MLVATVVHKHGSVEEREAPGKAELGMQDISIGFRWGFLLDARFFRPCPDTVPVESRRYTVLSSTQQG